MAARYAQLAPSRNDGFAAAATWFPYWGDWRARSSAVENESWSSLWVVSETFLPDAETAAAIAAAYPAVRSAPKIEVISAPPRSRWRSAVPDAIPTRATGTEPVREFDDGVPARPTPIPTRA